MSQPQPVQSASVSWLRSHIDHVLSLPAPGVEYTKREAVEDYGTPERVVYDLRAVSRPTGPMDKVGRRERRPGVGGTYAVEVWRTNRQQYETAIAHREGRATLPCEHRSGFETIAAGERYQCGFVACEREYDRETVAEVFG